ncbi:MAG: ferrochelatase [Bacteroidota bacterium]
METMTMAQPTATVENPSMTHPMLKRGVLLVNLGTPDAPTYGGLRSYLNQFLTDRRVIDLPAFFRHLLFKGIVVPIRSGKVSKLYQRLWLDDGSPLKVYGQSIADQVQSFLGDDYHVELAMRYQNPSLKDAIDRMYRENVSEIVVFPLFPQYASATTGSVFEEVMRLLSKKEQIPSIRMINSYYDHPEVISLYADRARQFDLDAYDHIVFSFHGVPKRYLKKENNHCQRNENCCRQNVPENQFCYSAQCHRTAFAIARELGIPEEKYTISYQSRFGPEEWVQPYTDKVLEENLEHGNKKILVFSPAFVADCLETTIEIGYEYKEEFMEDGGEALDLVPSLNDDPEWARIIANMVR